MPPRIPPLPLALDESRARHGLPSLLSAVADADRYRAPTRGEKAHPELYQLYRLDRDLARLRHLARHAALEAQRFERDAQQASFAAYQADFLRSAAAYRQQISHYQSELLTLKNRRQALMQALWQRAPHSPPSPAP
jgi:hypothetical protein